MPKFDSYTKILMHFNGPDGQAPTYYHEEVGGVAVTNQASSFDTDQKKFGTASIYCDGDGNSGYGTGLIVADNDRFNIGSSDFTLDFWVRIETLVDAQQTLLQHGQHSSGEYWKFTYRAGSTDALALSVYDGGSETVAGSWSWEPDVDTWYHIALVREGDDFKVYINGTAIGSTVTDSSDMPEPAYGIYVGRNEYNGGGFYGWIDELRLSVGIARWTSNFTAPTAAYEPILGDYQDDADTVLLLHGDGGDYGTTFIEECYGTSTCMTDQDSVQTLSTVKKIGRSAFLFHGSGYYDVLKNASNYTTELWHLAGDFTFDAWVNFDTLPSSGNRMCLWSQLGLQNYDYFAFGLHNDGGTYKLYFRQSESNTSETLTIDIAKTWSTPSADTWYHIAITRSGSSLRIFVDGTQVGSTETTAVALVYPYPNTTGVLSLGADYSGWGYNHYFDGSMDEIRISKVARWTDTFTPQTTPYLPEGVAIPGANGDDGYNSSGGSFYSTGDNWLGPYPRTFIRFVDVKIPQGATITSAVMKFKSTDYGHGDLSGFTIYCNDVDNAVAPTDSADLNSKALTTASEAWTPGTWSADTWYETPDITDVIQEVVNRVGYAAGNAVMVIVTGGSNYGAFYAYDEGFDFPELWVEWAVPYEETASDSFSVDDSNATEYGAGTATETESFSVDDSAVTNEFYTESISDSFSMDDSASASRESDMSIADSFSVLGEMLLATVDDETSESFSMDDSVVTNEFYTEPISDSFSVDDAASDELATVYIETITDTFSLDDTNDASNFYYEAISEDFTVSEEVDGELVIMCHLDPFWSVPLFSFEAEGNGWYISFVQTLPSFITSATGDTATVCYLEEEASLPALTCEGYAGAYADAQLWTPYQITLSAHAMVGDVASLTSVIPSFGLSGHANIEQVCGASLSLPHLRFTGTMVHDVNADLAVALPRMRLSASALSGDTIDALLSLPLFRFDGTAFQSANATLSAELPGLFIVAHANGGDTGYYVVPVMNLRNSAVCEWGMGINSVAQFNGKTVVTDGTSLYEVTGTTDDLASADAEIVCNIKTGNLDLANWSQMRLTDAYLNIKADGNVKFYFELDEDAVYEVEVEMHDLVDTHQEKVNLAKGMKARVYAVSLFNVDGSTFHLNKLQFIGQRLD